MASQVKFAELRDSRMVSEGGGTTTDRRRFSVPLDNGLNEIEALTYPGVPQLYSQHPTVASLYCDSRAIVDWIGGQGAIVECLYSNDGRFRSSPQRNENDTEARYTSMTSERAEVVMPMLVATPLLVPVDIANDPAVAVGWEWQRFDRKLAYYREIFSREVLIDTWQGATTRNTIEAQYYQIHKFDTANGQPTPNAKDYLFLPADVYDYGGGKARITYQWQYEPPVPAPARPPLPSGSPFTVEQHFVIPPARPSFFEYQIIPGVVEFGLTLPPSNGVTVYVPSIAVADRFPDNRAQPLGWQSLPGAPLTGFIT